MTEPSQPRPVAVRTKAGSKPKPDDEKKSWLVKPFWRGVRYALALAVIVGAIVFSLMNRFEVCEVVTEGADRTTTCGPPDLTQASVLAVVAFVLAMLWPDIQEVSAFGVSVKRLEEKVDEVGETVEQVGTAASHISTTADFTRTGVAQLQGSLGSQDQRLSEILEGLRGLDARVETVVTQTRYPARNQDTDPYRIADQLRSLIVDLMGEGAFVERRNPLLRALDEARLGDLPGDLQVVRVVLVGQLLELWQELGGRTGSGVAREEGRGQYPMSSVLREDALGVLGRLIDALTHGVPFDPETLIDAVVLARWLRGY